MSVAAPSPVATVTQLIKSGLGTPLALIIMLAMVMVPLPPFALDLLFTFSMTLSLAVLLASVYTKRPLDFAVFPSLLLVATLLRLALNVASTRVVLLEGHQGTDAAGRVIEAFGRFVIGGNFAVGFVVFAILVIINFIVVTKGSGRVSEVSARFTLDALPGKQMAIDADLNAGIIDQAEAKRRRAEVVRESDFYGSMDGASKFVRGDAVAGLLILAINIVGGLAVGALQHGLTLSEAAEIYVLLTIGDGLVAQIPSLLLSTAAAIMVTRNSSEATVGEQVGEQLLSNPRTLWVTAAIIGFLGLIPGMPNLPFLILASVCGYMAYRKSRPAPLSASAEMAEVGEVEAPSSEVSWTDVPTVDPIGLEVGYRLIPLVDNASGQLLTRIRGVRKKLSQELGFLVPTVHVRDNLELEPSRYRLLLHGVCLAEDDAYPDRELAINPGQVFGELTGIKTRDPAFGLEALWIEPMLREQAQTLGYTVVDASTVIATHLNQVLIQQAHLLLGHDEVQALLDRLSQSAPQLVAELTPNTLPRRVIVRVLQNLLLEQVPLKSLKTVVETLVEQGSKTQEPEQLTAAVRSALGRMIVNNICGIGDELAVVTLDPQLEQMLVKNVQPDGGPMPIEPGLAERLYELLLGVSQQQDAVGQPCILLVADPLRAMLARLVRHSIPNLHVLGFSEIPEDKRLRVIASVGGR